MSRKQFQLSQFINMPTQQRVKLFRPSQISARNFTHTTQLSKNTKKSQSREVEKLVDLAQRPPTARYVATAKAKSTTNKAKAVIEQSKPASPEAEKVQAERKRATARIDAMISAYVKQIMAANAQPQGTTASTYLSAVEAFTSDSHTLDKKIHLLSEALTHDLNWDAHKLTRLETAIRDGHRNNIKGEGDMWVLYTGILNCVSKEEKVEWLVRKVLVIQHKVEG